MLAGWLLNTNTLYAESRASTTYLLVQTFRHQKHTSLATITIHTHRQRHLLLTQAAWMGHNGADATSF